ncbi:sensor histidine kinase [Sphaerisporangium fuscum]|uniref:sensor histidine kinase n=1 Tax=Sphaerisporangium fuscum TaxID=2835868 RepID=UPI001BDD0994|nr:DUF4118 domain-containing protein [Sphaerisporangium fuscum]
MCVALETLIAHHLDAIAPVQSLAIVYLPAVLLFSLAWGLPAGILLALVSVLAYNYVFIAPYGSIAVADSEDIVTIPIFLVVAAVTSWLAARVRRMAAETTRRRQEADLSARLGQILLGTIDLEAGLEAAASQLAVDLGLPEAKIEVSAVTGDEAHRAVPLVDGRAPVGTLLLPAGTPSETVESLRARIVPSLAALVRAARDRAVIRGSLAASRDEYRRVAEEQAALRRVATLVARGVSPTELFSAVACEMGRLLHADHAGITQFDRAAGQIVSVGSWSVFGPEFMLPVGFTWPADHPSASAKVWRTGRPARMTDYATAGGHISEWARTRGIRSSVACPITVDGRLWGAMVALAATPFQREDAERRMVGFTELLGTAIANAQAHAQLAASRARVMAAADESRRRVERDLHDGAQQRLVSLGLELRAVEAAMPPELEQLREQLSLTVEGLGGVLQELQEISRGLHPAILSKGGLAPALKVLARRSSVPVKLEVDLEGPLAERVEVTVYYVVSEALTNIAKHAQACEASVRVTGRDGAVELVVHDDGVGGARLDQGSGLIGLMDRVEALSGRMEVFSPKGNGTRIEVRIPAQRR